MRWEPRAPRQPPVTAKVPPGTRFGCMRLWSRVDAVNQPDGGGLRAYTNSGAPMPTVHKVQNEDGSFTIMANGQPVRSTHDSLEADEVVRSLGYMAPDEDERPSRNCYA